MQINSSSEMNRIFSCSFKFQFYFIFYGSYDWTVMIIDLVDFKQSLISCLRSWLAATSVEGR